MISLFKSILWCFVFSSVCLILVSSSDVSSPVSIDETLNEFPQRVKLLFEKILPNGIPRKIIQFYSPVFVENNTECFNHSIKYVDNFKNYRRWAIQMADSSGKIPSGMLSGHFHDLGNYVECIEAGDISPFPVQYCLIQFENLLRLPKKPVDWDKLETIVGGVPMWKPNINIGVCLPASCSQQELRKHYNSLTTGTNLTVFINKYSCTASNEKFDYDILDWIGLFYFSTLLLVVSVCTLVSFIHHGDSKSVYMIIIKSFSAYNNGKKILKTKNPKTKLMVINGIRTLSIVWIMISHHCLFTSVRPGFNYIKMSRLYSRLFSAIVLNGILAVDTFLILNGCLLSYYFLQHKKSGAKFSLIAFYLHRLIRILPAYTALLIGCMTLFPRYYGDGPMWKHYMYREMEICRENWWTNLLFINNYVYPDKQCIPSTWYLSVDMQLYLLSPLILIPLSKWKNFAKYGLPLLITIAVGVVFFNSYIHKIPAGSVIARDYRTSEKHRLEYVTTHTKIGHWLIGVGLGFILQNTEKVRPVIKSKKLISICWIFCTCTGLGVLFGISYFHQDSTKYNRILSSLYSGFSSAIWAICVCWIILACEMGIGGPVHKFLSWRLFQPLGKLTFIIYLTHVGLQYGALGNQKTSPNFEIKTVVVDTSGEMIVIAFFAPIFCLIFESPFISLESSLNRRINQPNTNFSAKENKELYQQRETDNSKTTITMNGTS